MEEERDGKEGEEGREEGHTFQAAQVDFRPAGLRSCTRRRGATNWILERPGRDDSEDGARRRSWSRRAADEGKRRGELLVVDFCWQAAGGRRGWADEGKP